MAAMVQEREDIVGLDSAILMHPMVWKSSGHVDGFSDPMADCKTCKKRFRADDPEGRCAARSRPSPLTWWRPAHRAAQLNLMFETFLGPVTDSLPTVPAPGDGQGIFANFANVV